MPYSKGNFFEGLREDYTVFYGNSYIYRGNWEQGTLVGEATVTKHNGDVHCGLFIDELLEGKGELTTEKARLHWGVQGSKPHGEGTIQCKTVGSTGESLEELSTQLNRRKAYSSI